MKAILEFELPEEEMEHSVAVNGLHWQSVLEDVDNWLRGLDKYQDGKITAADVRNEIRNLMADKGLSF